MKCRNENRLLSLFLHGSFVSCDLNDSFIFYTIHLILLSLCTICCFYYLFYIKKTFINMIPLLSREEIFQHILFTQMFSYTSFLFFFFFFTHDSYSCFFLMMWWGFKRAILYMIGQFVCVSHDSLLTSDSLHAILLIRYSRVITYTIRSFSRVILCTRFSYVHLHIINRSQVILSKIHSFLCAIPHTWFVIH